MKNPTPPRPGQIAQTANEKGRQANPAALPLQLEPAYFTSTMFLSDESVVPLANVAL